MFGRWTLVLAAVTFSMACRDGNAGRDDGGPDATLDVPLDAPTDRTTADTGADGSDAGPATCLDHPVRDLVADGMFANGTWTVTAANDGEPDGLENALQPDRSDCAFRAVRQVLYRYTLRSRAALRASTDNPGSRVGFDTVLFVLRPPCTPSPNTVIACNDDNPFVGRSDTNMLSVVTTPVLSAGTTVIISVAGFYPRFGSSQLPQPAAQVGTYELTVTELPPVDDGGTCDLRGNANVCNGGSTCIATYLGSDQGVCRREGSVPGAACIGRMTCTAPLTCDTNSNACFETVAADAACDRLDVPRRRCAAGFSCVDWVRGGREGHCAAAGSTLFAACAAGNVCMGAGLVCSTPAGSSGQCLRAAMAGGECSLSESLCPSGQSCVPVTPNADVGQCVATGSVPGAPCLDTDPECASPLFCTTSGFSDRRCRTVGAEDGGVCGTWGSCAGESDCVVPDPATPTVGTCVPRGRPGGTCAATGLACETGSTCTNPTSRDYGRCLRIVARGGSCDVAGRTSRCDPGNTCVPLATGGPLGTCIADGTSAGTNCRSSTSRCDAGLACTTSSGAGRCVRDVARGDACDVRFATTRCASGTFCRGSSLRQGTCIDALGETEPNDHPEASTMPLTLPRAVRGVLERLDVDCVTFDVAEGGRVFAQATAPDGRCAATLAIDLYRFSGTPQLLGTDVRSGPSQCPRIEGALTTQFPWAQSLSAGRYAVCLREATSRNAAGAYVLSVHTD